MFAKHIFYDIQNSKWITLKLKWQHNSTDVNLNAVAAICVVDKIYFGGNAATRWDSVDFIAHETKYILNVNNIRVLVFRRFFLKKMKYSRFSFCEFFIVFSVPFVVQLRSVWDTGLLPGKISQTINKLILWHPQLVCLNQNPYLRRMC